MARQKPMYIQTSKLREEPSFKNNLIRPSIAHNYMGVRLAIPLQPVSKHGFVSNAAGPANSKKHPLAIFYSFSFEFMQIRRTNEQRNMSTLSKQSFLQTCKLRAHSLPFAIWQLWSSWILVVELFVSAQKERKPLVLNLPGQVSSAFQMFGNLSLYQ